ncbi:hypothetical protein HanIR_Chr01g0019791 [Helianthus annuus]|nr:hypothetical protein HanIR_Chr01g0019791 [Helianthus annuus]
MFSCRFFISYFSFNHLQDKLRRTQYLVLFFYLYEKVHVAKLIWVCLHIFSSCCYTTFVLFIL